MSGLRTVLGGCDEAGGHGACAWRPPSCCSPRSPRRRRRAMPTPRSTQAWDAGGGATGSLGPQGWRRLPRGQRLRAELRRRQGLLHPRTPAPTSWWGRSSTSTWRLGGPADGDLGFPDDRRGRAARRPNSRNTTFSAADNPVIFLTPDTGARVVRGAINAAWDKLGGSAGGLGVPTDDEVYGGDVASQNFSGGKLSWNAQDQGVHHDTAGVGRSACGPGGSRRCDLGHQRRPPGRGGTAWPAGRRADGPPSKVGADGLGAELRRRQDLLQPARPEPSVVTGQVLAKYESVGGPEGDLGFPPAARRTAALLR